MKGMGKKKLDTRITEDTFNLIDDIAVEKQWTRSFTARRALEEFAKLYKEGKIEL